MRLPMVYAIHLDVALCVTQIQLKPTSFQGQSLGKILYFCLFYELTDLFASGHQMFIYKQNQKDRLLEGGG